MSRRHALILLPWFVALFLFTSGRSEVLSIIVLPFLFAFPSTSSPTAVDTPYEHLTRTLSSPAPCTHPSSLPHPIWLVQLECFRLRCVSPFVCLYRLRVFCFMFHHPQLWRFGDWRCRYVVFVSRPSRVLHPSGTEWSCHKGRSMELVRMEVAVLSSRVLSRLHPPFFPR